MVNLLVLPSLYSYPGQARCGSFVCDQIQALSKAGANLTLAYVEPRSLTQFSWRALRESHWQSVVADEAGVNTLRQKGWNPFLGTSLGGQVWARLLERLVLRKCSNLDKFDLIHAHNAIYAGVAARNLSQRLGIPYVVTEHSSAFLMGTVKPAEERMVRLVYQDAAAVVTVSSALGRAVSRYCGSSTPRVIPNLVDIDYFRPAAKARTGNEFHIVSGGNLTRNKGYDILIRGFAAAFRNLPECRLTLMGNGPERASLERIAMSSGVRDRVLFTGAIHRHEVREYMQASDVFAISSYHETFGIVAIEALATGLPVIATRCGGPEDIVTPENGWLVKPGSVDEMRDALLAAHGHRIDLRPSRDSVLAKFSMAAVAGKLLDLYGQVSRAAKHPLVST